MRTIPIATLSLLAACFAPSLDFGDGTLACGADGSCPGGFHCAADGMCWRDGHDPLEPGADAPLPGADAPLPGADAPAPPDATPGAAHLFADAVRHEFGAVAPGEHPTTTFTITNTGTSTSGQLSVVRAGSASFSMDASACDGAELPAGGACAIVVTFGPAGTDIVDGQITIDATPGGRIDLTVEGSGLGPADLMAPAGLDFGKVVAGQTASAEVRIANVGSLATGRLTATIADGADFAITDNGCDVALAPGATCAVSVTFTAEGSPGTRAATLDVGAGGGPSARVALSATVLMPGALAIAPAAPSFATIDVSKTASLRFTVTNTGDAATGAVVTELDGSDRDEFSSAGGDGCAGTMLAAGASCTIDVAFVPTSAGTKHASLSVSTDATGIAVPLSASATARLTVAPAGAGSGSVTSSPDGISCGAACAAIFNVAPAVLNAKAATGSTFVGWSLASCPGTAPCSVPLDADTTVTARFDLQRVGLTVATTGAGAGTVTGAGIDCGAACSATYDYGSQVMLTATPAPGSTFVGWAGACSGAACIVTLDGAKSVTADFALKSFTLTVQKQGAGTGSVSDGAKLSCGSACRSAGADYPYNATVTLHAQADPGSTFTGWSVAGCVGTDCTITVSDAATVVATFATQSYHLAVDVTPAGGGTVSFESSTCAPTCGGDYAYGATVTLSARAATGFSFAGWSGDCTSDPCTVTMTGPRSVTATFVTASYPLTVTLAGTGGGTVTSSGATPAIACSGGSCTQSYPYQTMVTLSAQATPGSTFGGWSVAGCTGTSCTVTVDAARTVTASFSASPTSLTVTLDGAGSVASTSDARISCATNGAPGCSFDYAYGASVTLLVTPAVGSSFAGWTGAPGCSTDPSCTVAVTTIQTITARFQLRSYTLTVTAGGSGSGTVSGGGLQVTAPGTKTTSVPYGTTVTFGAAPATGSTVTWAGCTPQGTSCSVTISGDAAVTATFNPMPVTLTVWPKSVGVGSVTACPTGQASCASTCAIGAPCNFTFDYGTSVTLMASAGLDTEFDGWSSPCGSGTSCTLTLTAPIEVDAFYRILYTMTVRKDGSGSGTVWTKNVTLTCNGSTCSSPIVPGKDVTLNEVPDPGSRFAMWSTGSIGTNILFADIQSDIAVTATFVKIWPLTVNYDASLGTVSPGSGSAYDDGTTVTLTATPRDATVRFAGWTGCDSPAANTCTMTMTAAKTVSASFIQTYTLTVNYDSSLGSVTPGGGTFDAGTTITLMATVGSGVGLAGWTGCTSTANRPDLCTLTLSANATVTATFIVCTYDCGALECGNVVDTCGVPHSCGSCGSLHCCAGSCSYTCN